ncbi:hypothetical protein J7K55_05050 [Candidatus Aerophobetes bacterium]|nr:hypothetical protein [Candidatus Aerophobetes bacterium]
MVLRFKNLIRWIGPLFLLLLLTRSCIANNIAKDELILLLEKKFSQIQTYECNMNIEVYNKETKYQNQKFIFKKPGMIYCEQLGSYRKRVVVIVDKKGQIRMGTRKFVLPIVSFLQNSRLLKGITGETLFESNWGYIIGQMKLISKDVDSYEVKEELMNGRDVYVAKFKIKEKEYVFYIEKELMVIVKLERYINNRIDNIILWKDIKINPEIEDSFFEGKK